MVRAMQQFSKFTKDYRTVQLKPVNVVAYQLELSKALELGKSCRTHPRLTDTMAKITLKVITKLESS